MSTPGVIRRTQFNVSSDKEWLLHVYRRVLRTVAYAAREAKVVKGRIDISDIWINANRVLADRPRLRGRSRPLQGAAAALAYVRQRHAEGDSMCEEENFVALIGATEQAIRRFAKREQAQGPIRVGGAVRFAYWALRRYLVSR